VAIFALVGASVGINRTTGAEPAGHATASEGEPADDQQQALQPVPDLSPDGCCYCTGACGRRNCYAKLLDKWAEVGYFNCRCRGSYKFPVPPQYTYHWPGMYAQRTMTEYNSPYRFPPLKIPPTAEAEPKADQQVGPPARQARFPVRQTSQAEHVRPERPAARSATAESLSQKIKRHYGID